MIWILKPNYDRSDDKWDPWDPWYDACFGMIISAETAQEAREIAQENACAETTLSPVFHEDVHERERDKEVWTEPELTVCVPLEEYVEENEQLIMQDIHHA